MLAFGLLFDLALVFGAERLAPLFRISSGWLLALGLLGLAKDLGYLAFVRLRKAPIRLGGWSVRVPSLGMTALQILVGTLDIVLVSSVLYLLLPESAEIAFLPFIAVYLASILVGVLSHVPAGLGVLESMLLLLLPHVPPAELLAAVLLYRVIYEIVPVLCALALWGTFELGSQHGAWRRLLRR
jgi:phosphatidylglycerol lysyltransferase